MFIAKVPVAKVTIGTSLRGGVMVTLDALSERKRHKSRANLQQKRPCSSRLNHKAKPPALPPGVRN